MKGTAYYPKSHMMCPTSWRPRVREWAPMVDNGPASLLDIDDVNTDRSRKMNSEVYGVIPSAYGQPNATKLIGQFS